MNQSILVFHAHYTEKATRYLEGLQARMRKLRVPMVEAPRPSYTRERQPLLQRLTVCWFPAHDIEITGLFEPKLLKYPSSLYNPDDTVPSKSVPPPDDEETQHISMTELLSRVRTHHSM